MRGATRTVVAAVLATVGLVAVTVGATPGPIESSSRSQLADFYQPPSPLPAGTDGDVIRSEPTDFHLDSGRLIGSSARATRVMYRSTDRAGNPVAVTGAVLVPRLPWIGRGERPIVAYAVGSQGLADRCAPSRQIEAGTEYEAPFIEGLLLRGYAVAMTDYVGLGTPGMHTYFNRIDEGHAVLDIARAAQRLPDVGLADDGPVLLSGYSQGGRAAASAAELAAEHAPDLDVIGAYVGAVPADVRAVTPPLEGAHNAGFLGYLLHGLDAAYPELDVDSILNDAGRRLLADTAQECVFETIAAHPGVRSETLTTDGRPITAHLDEQPLLDRVAEQRVGTVRPSMPVLQVHGITDEFVPREQALQLRRDWCALGADLHFRTHAPSHTAAAATGFSQSLLFFEARVAGLPALGNC